MLFAPPSEHRLHVSSLAIQISFACRIMPDSLYCEPCRRLLRGDLSVVDKYDCAIEFEHHNDRESLANAIRLPCAICTRTHCYGLDTISWLDLAPQTKIKGSLSCHEVHHNVVELYFFSDRDMEKHVDYSSTRLALIPWSGGHHV